MRDRLNFIINSIDNTIANNYTKLFNEKKSLIIFLFHGLFIDKSEIALNYANPQQSITLGIFRQIIEYLLENEYVFTSPQAILNGLSKYNKYILLTFDDGYFNNYHSLQLLKEFKVPATFFISAGHISNNKCYWWDIIYRERIKRGNSIEQISKETNFLKQGKNDEIESYILKNFGEKAFEPISDIDRPFSPTELKSFSLEPFVFLGNHTTNHAILTNYSNEEVELEISQAQDLIYNLTGIIPISISYPNGNCSNDIMKISQKIGLKLGITVNQEKNSLPINLAGINPFSLNRITLWGDKDINRQLDYIRSDIHFAKSISKIFQSSKDGNRMPY